VPLSRDSPIDLIDLRDDDSTWDEKWISLPAIWPNFRIGRCVRRNVKVLKIENALEMMD
jgi:hypothetical protein